MAIVKISDLPLVDEPVQGTDLFVVVQDNVTKKAYASDIQTYVGFEEVQTATAGQTVFNLTQITYAAGANNLMVFVDGVNQYEGSSYTETDNNTVTFTQGLHEGALVKFSTVQTQTSQVASAGAVSFTAAGTGAVPTNVQARLRETVSVKDFGAQGDGVADDTVAIQAAINSLSNYSMLVFPPGNYKIGQVIFNGISNLAVSAYGARFILTGNSAGFVVKGVCSNIYVQGGVIFGDGVNRDASPSTAQIGWLFGNEAGAYVQNVFVQDVVVDAANVGFKFAAGTGTGSGNTNNVKITRCQAKDIVGVVGGVGYGFSFTQAPYSSISDCQAINCGRHGIYFSEGRDYAATNCVIRDHRSSVFTSAYRVGFSISRSRNVSVSNCIFDNCYDGSLEIDTDTQGTPPDNVLVGVAVSNCAFYNSKLADIRIGTDPVTDGNPYDVVVSNCVMVRGNNIISSIVLESGERIKIDGCLIRGYGSASSRAISVKGTGGAAYTDNIDITNNQITNWDIGVQIASALQTGASAIRIRGNQISATTAEFEFLGGEDATTNNNLIYSRSNGYNANRSYTSSGSNITVPVGGLTDFTFSASSATTVLNFSGGTEGQELTCYFTNGNTTLLNTNFYTAGAVNFVGSQYDTITFVYLGGFWREKCRSLN
jgi:hypothetical protein